MSDVQITTDGITVWVNTREGAIGRFGQMGIDIHTADGTACLQCTHEPTTLKCWILFVIGMRHHHGIEIGPEYKPVRFA
jgi:hypothetical protein